ncbi:sugar O-acyltransferase (sialic acid O-acetyltransferase NeuD family) [Ochrobactrum sp. RH1CCR137]|nr:MULTISPECIES: NeuD/PglB/VioB family sugar acetyltransferase [unclassified Ochrobactrum]MBA8845678.1 sugar O-acyltransferase (sialic acid O-acetyltransferase NeuD family) [Ochrobactrum sp. RH1CCR137]MBA8857400.1 sugar O-acyltransferase (sialic acid O-acetyltransferase NeuD family) [Ochrobactrum sp. RH1CCR134]
MNTDPKTFIIYGAGGHARELRAQLELEGCKVVAFVDDCNHGHMIDGTPVIEFANDQDIPHHKWLVGVGDISARKKIFGRLNAAGKKIGTFISRHARVSRTATVGEGCQIFAGCILSDNVIVGTNSILLFNSVVSHDSLIGDHCFLGANSSIAGWVSCRSEVWIGIGAIVSNGTKLKNLVVGENAIVGAGSCVIREVLPNTTVVGVPATLITRNTVR